MTVEISEKFNLARYLLEDRLEEGAGDNRALILEDREWTYGEVDALSSQFGHVLSGLGVRQEERVMIALPDSPEFVGALFGILKIGAVVVMINPHLKPDQITYFLNYTRARVAVVHDSIMESFQYAIDKAEYLDKTLIVGQPVEGYPHFSRLAKEVPDTLAAIDTHKDDPAMWLFSGGTTGSPKAVVQSHHSFANTTELYAKRTLGYQKNDITLSVPKLFFGYATGSNLFFPFSVGASTVLFSDRPSPELIFEKIRKHQPTIMINVPTMINRMVNHPEAANQDLSCLRFSTSAGEALPSELHHKWNSIFGSELLDGLGTAEMWHIFISNRPGEVYPGTLGKTVPGFEVKVCDSSGNTLSDNQIGELWVRGDSRALYYWQQMEKTAQAFQGEWYVSGDLVQRDGDGVFTYCGRKDDMIKVTGKWVSPKEIENCLLQHRLVKECAVVGMKDDSGLMKAHAFVIPAEQEEQMEKTLQDYVVESLAPYKAPKSVTITPSLPRTHLGKIDRGKLRTRDTVLLESVKPG